MGYVKGILSGLTAIILAECVPMFRSISKEKATGLAAVAGGMVETALSPLFWILAALFFALFFAASRLGNKFLRVLLFWIPTLTVSALTMAIVALVTYLVILTHP